ncbi:MAG: hypothetical protein OQK24_06100 [Magnetovibrio sp.]|nr:hypothetical protein [Magnetovibrio sp.]
MDTNRQDELSMAAQEWLIPISEGNITLSSALQDLRACGDRQGDIPLLVQLVENPRFHTPGLDIFHGRVDLLAHDCIHILLGRGMLAKDEAFVIGFTMGSTNRINATEEKLFSFIAQHFYPGVYRFSEDDISVFRDALRLGFISHCIPLDRVDYDQFQGDTLSEVREKLGIEVDLLKAYYAIEARHYPNCPESIRLLS